MPALNFAPQFAQLVEDGRKRQSIRAPRKRPIKIGDWLALYTGQRRPECRKLGEAIVERVERVEIKVDRPHGLYVGGVPLGGDDADEFARADGFEDRPELIDWFGRTHGFPFSGSLICWRLLPRAEWRKP